MLDDSFLWLVNWFDRQCDGYWEGSTRIQIENYGKSGWSFSFSIKETELEDKIFSEISINRSENDWINCKIENGFFEGRCGGNNCYEVLQLFRSWAIV